MQDTDLDFLFDGLPPEEAKRMRRILAEWRIGDEHSFPVQLALLTRAQWKAAAKTPVLLKQSLELLDKKLGEYRQQTANMLKDFNAAADFKVQEIQELIADHKEVANVALADLRGHTTTAKRLLNEIDHELTKGTSELKRFRDEFVTERHRLAEERVRYEQQKGWADWFIFGLMLLFMMMIGVLIGWKWHF
jgi:hypothetical protein